MSCHRLYPRMLGLLLCCLILPVSAASILRLEQLEGSGEVINGPSRDPLLANMELQAGDQLSLAADSRAVLTLGRNGVLELGPGASLRVEELPFASFADDLHTVLRLQRGYLRLIWKQRPWDLDWPLAVLVDSEHASLKTGEYYFAAAADESTSQAYRYCVAEGQIELNAPPSPASRGLTPGRCYRLHQNSLQVSELLNEASWTSMRESRRMMAAPEASAAAPATSEAGTNELAPAEATVIAQPEPPVVTAPFASSPPEAGAAVPASTWAINFASYSDRRYAEALLKQVRAAGFKAKIEQTTLSRRHWYRVRLPSIPTRQQADQLLRRLQGKGFSKVWIVTE